MVYHIYSLSSFCLCLCTFILIAHASCGLVFSFKRNNKTGNLLLEIREKSHFFFVIQQEQQHQNELLESDKPIAELLGEHLLFEQVRDTGAAQAHLTGLHRRGRVHLDCNPGHQCEHSAVSPAQPQGQILACVHLHDLLGRLEFAQASRVLSFRADQAPHPHRLPEHTHQELDVQMGQLSPLLHRPRLRLPGAAHSVSAVSGQAAARQGLLALQVPLLQRAHGEQLRSDLLHLHRASLPLLPGRRVLLVRQLLSQLDLLPADHDLHLCAQRRLQATA